MLQCVDIIPEWVLYATRCPSLQVAKKITELKQRHVQLGFLVSSEHEAQSTLFMLTTRMVEGLRNARAALNSRLPAELNTHELRLAPRLNELTLDFQREVSIDRVAAERLNFPEWLPHCLALDARPYNLFKKR